MTKGFVIMLVVVLLMTALTAADASLTDEQNDPHSFKEFTEGEEDEGLEDLSQVLERLLRENRPPCKQCNHNADQSATEQDYNENEEGSQKSRFDDYGNSQLQPNLIGPESGQIESNQFDEFRRLQSHRRLDSNGTGQMKRNKFDGFTTTLKESHDNIGQLKRNNFNDFTTPQSYLNLRNSDEGQIKRNHVDDLSDPRSYRKLNEKGSGQFRRSNNYFKNQRSRAKYGDKDTPQTEGSQTDRINSPIQRSYSDNFESEQLQSRQYDSGHVEIQNGHYDNSEEQQTPRKYIDGQESRRIRDNQLQNLQSEPQLSQPTRACTSKLHSGCQNLQEERDIYYVDYGNPQEEIRQHYSKANDRKKSKSAEAEEMSSDELLALLVKLARDKRRNEPPKT